MAKSTAEREAEAAERRQAEKDEAYQKQCEARIAAGLPVDPPEPDLPGYDEPEGPVDPVWDEPEDPVDNRTRDGMQVPLEPDDPSVQAEGSGEAGDG